MPDERWRAIPGHKGYEASSLGRVRSVPRTLKDGRKAGGTVLAPQWRGGYLAFKAGGRWVSVHVAVQLAFAGPPEVRHRDGDRGNCKPGNLVYGSRVENEQDKRKGEEKKNREEKGSRVVPVGTFPVTGCCSAE